MEIVISTDNNYIMPTGVLMTSICENNKDEKIVFHILIDESVSVKSKESLNKISGRYDKEITYYLMDKSLLVGFPVGRDGLPVSAYYRLCVDKILPNSINKVLYLDCDIIVRHSLKKLWNTNIENYSIGCILDYNTDDIYIYNRLRMLQSYGYFNSGVALINLKKWREENLYVKFREFVNKHQDRILCSDQDILNYVLRKDKLELPLTYNFQDAFMVVSPNLPRISWTKEQEICNASMDPCIVHFSTKHSKPWFKDCGSPYQKEFIKYLKLTEWANMPLKIRPRTKKELIKIFLKQIGLLKWSYGIEYKKLPIQE